MLLAATWFFATSAWALDFKAERDPTSPAPHRQYRLVLHTPGRKCADWRKVTPDLPTGDLLLSSSKRDDPVSSGKRGEEEIPGCRFLWVITPQDVPGATKFTLEPFGKGTAETFSLPAAAGYQPAKATPAPASASAHMLGVANENGNGPAETAIQGKVSLPSFPGGQDSRPSPSP